MGQVLVLNASYEPLNITTWRRATVLMLKGKAESLEENPNYALRPDFKLPTVIRLLQFIKLPYREIPLTRKNILQRDNNICQYCYQKNKKLSIDHVLPRSRGGLDSWQNVVTACLDCNIEKGSRTPEAAKMLLKNKPYQPISNLNLQAKQKLNSGMNSEWKKYLIGWSN